MSALILTLPPLRRGALTRCCGRRCARRSRAWHWALAPLWCTPPRSGCLTPSRGRRRSPLATTMATPSTKRRMAQSARADGAEGVQAPSGSTTGRENSSAGTRAAGAGGATRKRRHGCDAALPGEACRTVRGGVGDVLASPMRESTAESQARTFLPAAGSPWVGYSMQGADLPTSRGGCCASAWTRTDICSCVACWIVGQC